MSGKVVTHAGSEYYFLDGEWRAFRRARIRDHASCAKCGRERVLFAIGGKGLCLECWFGAAHSRHAVFEKDGVRTCSLCHTQSGSPA